MRLGLGGALLLLALGSFATNGRQFGQLMQVGLACALIWLPPLIVLSFAAPWLRTPSQHPRIWDIVAFGVALLLVVMTWERLRHPPESRVQGAGMLVQIAWTEPGHATTGQASAALPAALPKVIFLASGVAT